MGVYVFCFSWLGMLIRCCVAALDFNFNVNRGTKVSSDGHQMYKMKACFMLVRVWTNITVFFFLDWQNRAKNGYCASEGEEGLYFSEEYFGALCWQSGETKNTQSYCAFVKVDFIHISLSVLTVSNWWGFRQEEKAYICQGKVSDLCEAFIVDIKDLFAGGPCRELYFEDEEV